MRKWSGARASARQTKMKAEERGIKEEPKRG